MVKMSEVSKQFLKKYLPDVAEAEEPNDILGPLYELIEVKGFDANDDYNNFGDLGQSVYDDIFHSNFND